MSDTEWRDVFVVVYYNAMCEGSNAAVFSTEEKAQKWIDDHPESTCRPNTALRSDLEIERHKLDEKEK